MSRANAVRDFLAPGRLAPLVLLDLLLRFRNFGCRDRAVRSEHHAQHLERELRFIGGQPLSRLPAQPELELSRSLEQLEIEPMIFVALPLSLGAARRHLFERLTHAPLLFDHLVETTYERGNVGHDRTVSSPDLASSHSREDLRSTPRRICASSAESIFSLASCSKKLEQRTMQSLVEDAVPIAIEPQHLQSVRPTIGEDEHRPTLGIFAE